jgi:hypothetical protein
MSKSDSNSTSDPAKRVVSAYMEGRQSHCSFMQSQWSQFTDLTSPVQSSLTERAAETLVPSGARGRIYIARNAI